MSGGGRAHCDPKHALKQGVCLCSARLFTGWSQLGVGDKDGSPPMGISGLFSQGLSTSRAGVQ